LAYRLFEKSEHSALYAKYRPQPPQELITAITDYLEKNIQRNADNKFGGIVDVGCGTGQATSLFANDFTSVLGVDVSAGQINEATHSNKLANVQFKVSPAEKLPLEDNSVDVVSCVQSFHWFDTKVFLAEAQRVLKPNGVLAVTIYDFPRIARKGSKVAEIALRDLVNTYFASKELQANIEQAPMSVMKGGYTGVDFHPFGEIERNMDLPFTCDTSGLIMWKYITSWSSYHTLNDRSTAKAVELEEQFLNDFKKLSGADVEDNTQFEVSYKYGVVLSRNCNKK